MFHCDFCGADTPRSCKCTVGPDLDGTNGVVIAGCECYGAKGWHYPPCPIPALLQAAKAVLADRANYLAATGNAGAAYIDARTLDALKRATEEKP